MFVLPNTECSFKNSLVTQQCPLKLFVWVSLPFRTTQYTQLMWLRLSSSSTILCLWSWLAEETRTVDLEIVTPSGLFTCFLVLSFSLFHSPLNFLKQDIIPKGSLSSNYTFLARIHHEYILPVTLPPVRRHIMLGWLTVNDPEFGPWIRMIMSCACKDLIMFGKI